MKTDRFTVFLDAALTLVQQTILDADDQNGRRGTSHVVAADRAALAGARSLQDRRGRLQRLDQPWQASAHPGFLRAAPDLARSWGADERTQVFALERVEAQLVLSG
jgi:hypothetical protein